MLLLLLLLRCYCRLHTQLCLQFKCMVFVVLDGGQARLYFIYILDIH
jgi:hypothetical protein